MLTNTQVSRVPKDFANGSSAKTNYQKTQSSKIRQSGKRLGRLLGPLPLMKNVLQPLAKNVSMPLELTLQASNIWSYSKVLHG